MRLFLPLVILLLLPVETLAQELPEHLTTIRTWTDEVKVEGNRTETRTIVLAVDYSNGETEAFVFDQMGRLIHREQTGYATPSASERERALEIIFQDETIGQLAGQSGVVVEGGFPLLRGSPGTCGEGSRCLQFDIYRPTGSRSATRLRYVVVDLVAGAVVEPNLDPSRSGNLEHVVNPESEGR